MYLARKYYLGTLFFGLSYWRRDRHFTWSSEAREGLPVCRAKGVPSFLSYFKTLSIGPVPAKLTLPRLFLNHSGRSTASDKQREPWHQIDRLQYKKNDTRHPLQCIRRFINVAHKISRSVHYNVNRIKALSP